MKQKLSILVGAFITFACSNAQESDRRPQPVQEDKPNPIERPTVEPNPIKGSNPITQPISSNDCNQNFTASTSGQIDTSGQAAVPILGSVNFSLMANAQFNVTGSESQGSIALNAQIQNFRPAIARSLADNIISSYRDPLTLTYATAQQSEALFKQSAWQGLECVVRPVTAVRNNSYEYRYNPPIPFLLNSNASAQDLAKIGSRQFPGIRAQIMRHPTASSGTHQGAAVLSTSGNTLTITYDFGGVAPRANSTPIKSVAYTLDGRGGYSSTKLSAFVSDNSLIDLIVGN